MCFYRIIYLKFEGGKKRKIFVLAPHSFIPVRRVMYAFFSGLFFNSYLFTRLMGRRHNKNLFKKNPAAYTAGFSICVSNILLDIWY